MSTATDKKPIASIGLEAQLIRKRLEKAEVGEVISYEELEVITHRTREEFRPSLYTAARQLFKEKGWKFGCVKGSGYKRLDASEKLDAVEGSRKHIHKTAVKAGAVLASIDVAQLPQAEQVRHNREAAFAGALALATSRKAVKAIEAKAETGVLPPKEALALFSA